VSQGRKDCEAVEVKVQVECTKEDKTKVKRENDKETGKENVKESEIRRCVYLH